MLSRANPSQGNGGKGVGLINLADVVSRQGDYEAARPIFEESVSILGSLGDRFGMAFAIDNSALAAARAGEPATARSLHERALLVSRELGDERGCPFSCN